MLEIGKCLGIISCDNNQNISVKLFLGKKKKRRRLLLDRATNHLYEMKSDKESELQKHGEVIFIENLRVRRNCQLLYYIILYK